MQEQSIVSASLREEERQFETAMRPLRLADFAGQSKLKEQLSIAIEAACKRGEAMDHVLLYEASGTGAKPHLPGSSPPSSAWVCSRHRVRFCKRNSIWWAS